MFDRDMVSPWVTYEEALTSKECQYLIDYSNRQEKQIAELASRTDISYRKNKVVWLEPVQELKHIYNKLTNAIVDINNRYFKFDIYGFTEKMQFTEYSEKNDNYNLHIDKLHGDIIRKLSIVVQLTNPKEYEGCNLEIHNSAVPETMKRDQGTLIAFPSYSLHKVTPLLRGTRYSLVAWVGGPQFK
jgi:PKHD-type hydroxylase